MEKVSKGSFSMSGVEFEAISKEAKKLISKLLQQDKDKRITALEAINDPWFDLVLGTQEQDIDTKTLSNLKNFNVRIFFVKTQILVEKQVTASCLLFHCEQYGH